jgi:integrase
MDSEQVNGDVLRRYFLRLAAKEEEYQQDICVMQRRELADTLKSLNIRREETRGHLLSLLRGYIDWARLNGVENVQKVIHLITPESIISDDSVKTSMIKSPEHLKEILDDGLDYTNYENRSKVVTLLFRLLYQGIPLDEIRSLKKTDIDYNTGIIKISDEKTYQIDTELAALWKECASITYIEKRNGKADTAKSKTVMEFIKYDLADNDYLFRKIAGSKADSNEPCSLNTFRKMVAYAFAGNEAKTIPARNINFSGLFYKLYQYEQSGNEITPEVLAGFFLVKYNNRQEMLANTRKWRIDYDDWKIAFGYM